MTEKERVNTLKQIDFGDIDGSGDPKLSQYFLDNNYWDKVIEKKTSFVIGKKGTGKSAVYRMIYEQSLDKGVMVENKEFGDFPFEKLLQLDDQSFAKPNQYQSIWKNLILNIFAQMIADHPVLGDEENIHYQSILKYVNSCLGNIVDLHKEVVNRTTKEKFGLVFNALSGSHEAERTLTIGNGDKNISMINASLQRLILDYFITCSPERKAVIQFDRLDDNYNQYQDVEQYYQAIISLFKVVYHLNQEFRAKNILNCKIVLYLRSDILKELGKRDAESARWDDSCLTISWAIVNSDDWVNSDLIKMINKRIFASIKNENIDFLEIFDNNAVDLTMQNGERCDVFEYMIIKTMHRPRDLIQFCKYIQKQTEKTGKLYFKTVKNAEKEYGYWLVNSELANEINPIVKNTDSLYELLKLLGRKPFTLSHFCERFRTVKDIDMKAEELAYYLYDVGIFQNIDDKYYRSALRNQGRLDRNMKIIIHPGVWIGIIA